LFTVEDKLDYSITIKYRIYEQQQYIEYLNHSNRELINELRFKRHSNKYHILESYQSSGGGDSDKYDFNLLPRHCLHKLVFFMEMFVDGARIPQSVTDVCVYSRSTTFSLSAFNIDILSNLPVGLKKLELPRNCKISVAEPIQLPQSFIDLDYESSTEYLLRLVPFGNRVLKNAVLLANTLEDLQVLQQRLPWVVSIILDLKPLKVNNTTSLVPTGIIPQQVKSISIENSSFDRCRIDNGALPNSLESLIVFPKVSLRLGTLPSHSLKILTLHYLSNELKPDVLPNTLEKLTIRDYRHPLRRHVLPHSLTYLSLDEFNNQLWIDILPPSLTYLAMEDFDNIIGPNALPTTLVSLYLPVSSGSFQFSSPLNNLNVLEVFILDASIVPIIQNVHTIRIIFKLLAKDLTLFNTSIKELDLCASQEPGESITQGFLPKSLEKFRSSYISFNINILPNKCKYI